MEKKTRPLLFALCVLLAALAGLALGLETAGHKRPIKGSGLNDREIEKLERRIEAASERCSGALSETRSTAREITDGLGGIGANANGATCYLGELAGIVAELQRRSQSEKQ